MNQPKNRWQPNAIYELQEKPVKPSYEELLKQRDELLQGLRDVLATVRNDEISFETIIGMVDDIAEQAIAKAESK
jgi:hypothetical protein